MQNCRKREAFLIQSQGKKKPMVYRGKEKRRLSFPELKKERPLLYRAKGKENHCYHKLVKSEPSVIQS
jgi:hypothetical protein